MKEIEVEVNEERLSRRRWRRKRPHYVKHIKQMSMRVFAGKNPPSVSYNDRPTNPFFDGAEVETRQRNKPR